MNEVFGGDSVLGEPVKTLVREDLMEDIRAKFESLGPVIGVEAYSADGDFLKKPKSALSSADLETTWRDLYQRLRSAIKLFNNGELTVTDLCVIMDLALDHNYEPITLRADLRVYAADPNENQLKSVNGMVLRAIDQQLRGRQAGEFFDKKLKKPEKAVVAIHKIEEDSPLGILKNHLEGNPQAKGWVEAVASMIYELEVGDRPLAIRMLWNRRNEIKKEIGDSALAKFFSFEGTEDLRSAVVDKLEVEAEAGYRSAVLGKLKGRDGESLFPFLDPLQLYKSVPEKTLLGGTRAIIERNATDPTQNIMLNVENIRVLPSAAILEVIYRIAQLGSSKKSDWVFAQMMSIDIVRVKNSKEGNPEVEAEAIKAFFLSLHHANALSDNQRQNLLHLDSKRFAFAAHAMPF